ncbi:MAG TPA: hypothetical protein VHB21_00735, partial [Minicystis sp.]|nr:hypothetical protein [Minicystis sp.]
LQRAETAVVAALFTACVASGSIALVAYALTCLALHAFASVWATWIPHHAPRALVRLAAAFAWTGSPTVLALAYHGVHHARPELPTAVLAAAARA